MLRRAVPRDHRVWPAVGAFPAGTHRMSHSTHLLWLPLAGLLVFPHAQVRLAICCPMPKAAGQRWKRGE